MGLVNGDDAEFLDDLADVVQAARVVCINAIEKRRGAGPKIFYQAKRAGGTAPATSCEGRGEAVLTRMEDIFSLENPLFPPDLVAVLPPTRSFSAESTLGGSGPAELRSRTEQPTRGLHECSPSLRNADLPSSPRASSYWSEREAQHEEDVAGALQGATTTATRAAPALQPAVAASCEAFSPGYACPTPALAAPVACALGAEPADGQRGDRELSAMLRALDAAVTSVIDSRGAPLSWN